MRWGAHSLKWIAITSFIMTVGQIHAGTTGKLMGTVVDTEGNSLPGASVTVVGTRLGATADTEGRFAILMVQPGSHTILARLIGYRATRLTGVVVQADLTTEINLRLLPEDIAVETQVIRAKRPAILKDVTSSQVIIGAAQIAQAPVSEVIDYLAYEPGVSVVRDNEIQIRGGGAEEIRFQVDGLDRTDALTSKGFTHLNQTMVSEVSVITGGFNAEYGNMRSGVINAVFKDGTEGGFGLPWVAAVYSHAPAQRKHFGPGAYDRDQYSYRLLADSALTGANYNSVNPLYWPDLYEATRNDTALQAAIALSPATFKVWRGWTATAAAFGFRGALGKKGWTAEDLREVWQWEANMDEQVWQYGNAADYNIDLSVGQSLPNNWGGIVVGYSVAKAMTAVPAIRPSYTDRTIDLKLTLTPIDQLKIRLSYLLGRNRTTGAGERTFAASDFELRSTGGGSTYGNDPIALRTPAELVSSVASTSEFAANNKLNLGFNSRLNGDYNQFGVTLIYTLNPETFLEFGVGRLESTWDQARNPPRVDPNSFAGKYAPSNSYAWGGKGGFLDRVGGPVVYKWRAMPELNSDGSVLLSGKGDTTWVTYPTHQSQVIPANIIQRSPFQWPEPYAIEDLDDIRLAAEAQFTTKDFYRSNGDTVTAVAPIGWVEPILFDLSGRFNIGGHRSIIFHHKSVRTTFSGSLVHARGPHTLKAGGELMMSDIDFNQWDINPIQGSYSRMRIYDAKPDLIGIFLQDKYESKGMIINIGLRGDRFNAGSPLYTPDNIFDATYWRMGAFGAILDSLKSVYPERVWPNDPDAALPEDPLTALDVLAAVPHRDNKMFWRLSPRVGISHPVGENTKLFFNYGHFYNMPQAKYLHGVGFFEAPLGADNAAVRDVEYSDLRPSKTIMYEVGVEQAFPKPLLLLTVRGFAKYSTDQISQVSIHPKGGQGYASYRNSNYETLRGLEVKLARTGGKHFYGWATYVYNSRASGQVGFRQLFNDPLIFAPTWGADAVTSDSPDNFQALAGVRTPANWGSLAGGWSLAVVQTWREGAETIPFNPDELPRQLLGPEFIMHTVDYWNTDLKFSKRIKLLGNRSLSAYIDVTNLWNTKRLAIGGAEYAKYLVGRRRAGEMDLKYGDESTWGVFTDPYKDTGGNWKQPIAPDLDFVQFLNPRRYRLGIRMDF